MTINTQSEDKRVHLALVGTSDPLLDELKQHLASLRQAGFRCHVFSDLSQLSEQAVIFRVAIVQSDINDVNACQALKDFYLVQPTTALIAVSQQTETERAMTLIKYGVQEVLDSQALNEDGVQKAVLFTLERNRYRQHLRKLSEASQKLVGFDALTGLPNLSTMREALQFTIANADRRNHRFALALVNFIDIKSINRNLGYETGDALLKLGAKRIQACVRASDQVARIGGDEFLVLLNDLKHSEDAALVLEKLVDKLSQPYQHHGDQLHIGCSIGVSHYPEDGLDSDKLMRSACAAAQCAKTNGYWCYEIFNQNISDDASLQINWLSDFHRALEKNEFELHYQPQIDTSENDIFGVEALVRWNHPTKGMIPPDQFIPNAEKHHLIVPLGDWVLNQACQQLRHWREAGVRNLRMSVNISAKQFAQPNFLEKVQTALQRYRLLPHYLELEVTESILMINPEQTAKNLKRLKQFGVHLSIDDFGTGYSSLSYLKQFPVDTLKVDRSFVIDLLIDSDSAAITQAVISLAHVLGLDVIAEGVEAPEQQAFLEQHNCHKMQGYLFSKPLIARECTTFLLENEKKQNRGSVSGQGTSGLTVETDER